jgi:hypothetical protein
MNTLARRIAGIQEANLVGNNKLPCGEYVAEDPAVTAKNAEHYDEAVWITKEAKRLGITTSQFIDGDY